MESSTQKNVMLFNKHWINPRKPLTFKECYAMSVEELLHIFNRSQYNTLLEVVPMVDCLARNFDAIWIEDRDYEAISKIKDMGVSTIITNGLHCNCYVWGFDRKYWQFILDLNTKLVPMTTGFHFDGHLGSNGGNDFLTKDMIYIFNQIAERNEIGVRGEYSYELLKRNGIKNLRLVGDISLFYPLNRDFKVRTDKRELKSVNCSDLNFYPYQLDHTYEHFLKYERPVFDYCLNLWKSGKVQVTYSMVMSLLEAVINFPERDNCQDAMEFLMSTAKYFFSMEDWVAALRQIDFTFCSSVHAAIASVVSGTPALAVSFENRMEEMLRVAKIPFIKNQVFDPERPLEYYYDLCDYSDFNKNYPMLHDNFVGYCAKNGVNLKKQGGAPDVRDIAHA